jgi:hypothetical protein
MSALADLRTEEGALSQVMQHSVELENTWE